MLIDSLKLFLVFLKVGIFGFAGGTALIPLIERECVTNHGWISPEDFSELLAVNAALPGLYGAKLAGYIGFRIAGPLGLLVSVLGVTLPGLLTLILFYSIILKYQETGLFKKALIGIKFGAAGFIAYSIFKVIPGSLSHPSLVMGVLLAGIICVALHLGIDPVLAIISAGIIGIFLF